MSWSTFRQFTPLVWIVILGTFMVRTSYYMVWPFLSILLYREYDLSATFIGLLLGGSMALSTLVSFYGGWLSDRFGRRSILMAGCLVAMLCFGLLGFSHAVFWLGVGVMGSGLSSGLIDAPGKALMADSLASAKARELALHLRYFLLNLGAALGPLMGVTLGINAQQETFLFLVVSYLLLALAFGWGFRRAGSTGKPGAAGPGLRDAIKVLLADRAFLLLVMANLLMVLVYSQFHSPLVQYLTRAGMPQVAELVALLVATNALTVVLLQFPLLRLLSRWPVRVRLHIGMALFLAAQLLFALGDPMVRSHWFGAVLLLSIGETILFPLLNVLIDQMAPTHLKGSYFGASALAGLGGAAGALLGGWILEQWSGQLLYVLMALLCVAIFALYEAGARHHGRRSARQESVVG
ncbi:MFS transporter [Aeromonas veronii]|uniref:MFS transporter n=1 Tax=Aeromonas veronii TaxID=654 RepID=UPI0013022639|nr:MFS transporter [Aeromonas veronii]KAE9638211.1 MFS transporter [Aeromonas veronii]